MKIKTTLNYSIQISEPNCDDVYTIEQGDDGRFYVTSKNGLWGWDGPGHASLITAIKAVHTSIKNYFIDRCIEAPKTF